MFDRVDLNWGWAEQADNSDPVEIVDRVVARRIRACFPGSGGQPQVEILIDSSSGRPRCVDVRFTATEQGPEVRSKDLRLLDVDDLTERLVALFSTTDYRFDDRGGLHAVIRVPDTESPEFRAARSAMRGVRRATRRVLSDQLKQQVVDIYRSDPDRPVKAVEKALGIGRSTAFRYIAEARKDGWFDKEGPSDGQHQEA